jgi:cytochrome c5
VRRGAVLAAGLLTAGAGLLAAQGIKKPAPAAAPAVAAFDESLPALGTKLAEMPTGAGKTTTSNACLKCHSADLLWQQRLNQAQWDGIITKMAGWGADFPAGRRNELLSYLMKNFGPDNLRFKPVVTRPAGR